jgi:hypothetical protein
MTKFEDLDPETIQIVNDISKHVKITPEEYREQLRITIEEYEEIPEVVPSTNQTIVIDFF